MAWRPNKQFIEGVLDNTVPGKVTGWMKFAGMDEKVVFDLEGNFHRDIRGAKVRLRDNGESADAVQAAKYMNGFSTLQKGKVGDMTAGLPPADYVSGYCYLEWYGEDNGRVVIELETSQVEVIGKPIPPQESDPVSRVEQARNMDNWLGELARTLQIADIDQLDAYTALYLSCFFSTDSPSLVNAITFKRPVSVCSSRPVTRFA